MKDDEKPSRPISDSPTMKELPLRVQESQSRAVSDSSGPRYKDQVCGTAPTASIRTDNDTEGPDYKDQVRNTAPNESTRNVAQKVTKGPEFKDQVNPGPRSSGPIKSGKMQFYERSSHEQETAVPGHDDTEVGASSIIRTRNPYLTAYLVENEADLETTNSPPPVIVQAKPDRRRLWLIAVGVLVLVVVVIAAVLGALLAQRSDGDSVDTGTIVVPTSQPSTTMPTNSPTRVPVLFAQLGTDLYGSQASDNMGTSVAISSNGRIVASGAIQASPNDPDATGYAQVHEWKDGEWRQLGDNLFGSSRGDHFGHAVALTGDGTILAVAAPYGSVDTTRVGTVHVFQFDNVTESWSPMGNVLLGANQEGPDLGLSVSLSDNDGARVRLAIGSPFFNDDTGKVDVYEVENEMWQQIGSSIEGEEYQYGQAGWSVELAADGSTIAIGERTHEYPFDETGRVRIFALANGDWEQLGSDINGVDRHEIFGSSVALSGDGSTVAIGAETSPVAVYRYEGGNWTARGQRIDKGVMVSLSENGNTIAVGDQRLGVGGQVRLLRYDDGAWDQIGETVAGQHAGERFGAAVSVNDDGTVFAVGAPLYGNIGYFGSDFAGAVRVFLLNES